MTCCLLFAMNRCCASDVARINTLETSGISCVTVSDCAYSRGKPHLTVDFKHQRGWDIVTGFVRRWCSCNSGRLIAFLDYFWLETHYFKNRYGLDWYDTKPASLLEAGLTKIFLPHSKELFSSLATVSGGIRVRYRNRTLLSDATARTALPPARGDNDTHISRLLHPPFLLFEFAHTLR